MRSDRHSEASDNVVSMKYDCHVEVFDPVRWRPVPGPAATLAASGTVTQLMSFARASGLRGQVLVQPMAYHASHGCLIDAVRRAGPCVRAVGYLSRYMPSAEVDALHRSGLRGTRFVLGVQPVPDTLEELAALHHMLPADWHIELSGSWRCVARLGAALARWGRTFVGTATDTWQSALRDDDAARLLRWMELGNFYLKFLLPARLVCADLVARRQPELARLLDGAPDRLLWGSGWPCTAPSWLGGMERTQWHGEPRSGRPISLAPMLDRNAQSVYRFADQVVVS